MVNHITGGTGDNDQTDKNPQFTGRGEREFVNRRDLLRYTGIFSVTGLGMSQMAAAEDAYSDKSDEELIEELQALFSEIEVLAEASEDVLLVDYRDEALVALKEEVIAENLNQGIEQSLVSQLDTAIQSNRRAGENAIQGDLNVAENMHDVTDNALNAFSNSVGEKSSGQVNEETASEWIIAAEEILNARDDVLEVHEEITDGSVSESFVERYDELRQKSTPILLELENRGYELSLEMVDGELVPWLNPVLGGGSVLIMATAFVVLTPVAYQGAAFTYSLLQIGWSSVSSYIIQQRTWEKAYYEALHYAHLLIESFDKLSDVRDVCGEVYDDYPEDRDKLGGTYDDMIGDESGCVEVSSNGFIQLENPNCFVQMDQDALDATKIRVGTAMGGPNDSDVTGPLITHPRSPAGGPSFNSTEVFEITDGGGQVGAYRAVRTYDTETDTTLQVTADVSLYGDDLFVLADYEFANTGANSVKLDHPATNIHSGLHLSEGVNLVDRTGAEDDYRFHLPGHGTHRFKDVGKWTTFSGTNYGTVFDDEDAVTHGLIEGDSNPRMWIEEDTHLDYLMDPVTLNPGDVITYTVYYAVHDGGEDAPSDGEAIDEVARSRADGELPDVDC